MNKLSESFDYDKVMDCIAITLTFAVIIIVIGLVIYLVIITFSSTSAL